MKIRHLIALIVFVLFVTLACTCSAHESEKFYQNLAARQMNGTPEVRLQDATRCDIVTASYAIEVDFAKKWCEAIGQSLYYSKMTGERAGILLIMTKPGDAVFLQRLHVTIRKFNLPIDVWTIDATTRAIKPAPQLYTLGRRKSLSVSKGETK